MAYEVTATRKRPQNFETLVGQEFVVSTLENAIKEGRIAHAYLFSGPRGVGKTSSARLLAKALNCEKGPTAHPCGVCSSCREIAEGASTDVIEIDGASNTSVNDIRAIKEEVLFPPQSSRYKIYIIDEVHMLSTSAFNALLKTIEEPPSYIIFIFATTELQKVPATIRSRCQQFRFQLISQELIIKCLRSAAEDLGIHADEDALFWISKEATGSMRDAYTLFDQVAAFSSDHITLQKIKERLNLAGFSAITEIVRASISGNVKDALEKLASLFDNGVSAERIVKDSAEFFRTLMLYKSGIRRPDLLGVVESDIPEDLVSALTEEQIEAALKAFINLYRDLRYTISPRLETELLVSRLSSLTKLISQESLLRKLEEMKNGIISGDVVIKKKKEPVVIEAPSEKTVQVQESAVPDAVSDPVPSMYSTEEPQDDAWSHDDSPFQVGPELLPLIQEQLRQKGLLKHSRIIGSARSIIEDRPGHAVITIASALDYNVIKDSTKPVENILSELAGEAYTVQFRAEEKSTEKGEISEEMQILRNIFGGNVIIHEKTAKERAENEYKPIRSDEADGLDRSPDEDS